MTNKQWKEIEREFKKKFYGYHLDSKSILSFFKSKFSQREEEMWGEIRGEIQEMTFNPFSSDPSYEKGLGDGFKVCVNEILKKLQSLKRKKRAP